MVAHAIQEELNYLFSDSLTDADLLRAVECIESVQAPQTSAASDVIPNTVRTELVRNAGGVEDTAQLHFGEFLYRLYIKYLYTGRSPRP